MPESSKNSTADGPHDKIALALLDLVAGYVFIGAGLAVFVWRPANRCWWLLMAAGGTWFLVKRLGLARALGCAMLGDKLSAKDAKEQGMIWDVAAEGEDCVEAAMKLAQRLAGMPTRALVETRKLLRAAASSELDAQLDAERDAQSAMGRTHDYIEGVMAFLERRDPQWTASVNDEWPDDLPV